MHNGHTVSENSLQLRFRSRPESHKSNCTFLPSLNPGPLLSHQTKASVNCQEIRYPTQQTDCPVEKTINRDFRAQTGCSPHKQRPTSRQREQARGWIIWRESQNSSRLLHEAWKDLRPSFGCGRVEKRFQGEACKFHIVQYAVGWITDDCMLWTY